LDTLLEPIIGLAEGENRGRGMTESLELRRPRGLLAISRMHRAAAPRSEIHCGF